MIYFTADQHFGHTKVIEYCDRPFSSVEEMNSVLIQRHNEVVNKGDLVYHLGDFAFKNHKQYLSQLKGNHYLIKGNHDGNGWKDAGFIWCKDVATIKCGNNIEVFCSHYAHRVWDRAHHGVIHAFGHSHNSLESYYKSCDVGVDAWNFYRPVSIDQLVELFKDTPNTLHH